MISPLSPNTYSTTHYLTKLHVDVIIKLNYVSWCLWITLIHLLLNQRLWNDLWEINKISTLKWTTCPNPIQWVICGFFCLWMLGIWFKGNIPLFCNISENFTHVTLKLLFILYIEVRPLNWIILYHSKNILRFSQHTQGMEDRGLVTWLFCGNVLLP